MGKQGRIIMFFSFSIFTGGYIFSIKIERLWFDVFIRCVLWLYLYDIGFLRALIVCILDFYHNCVVHVDFILCNCYSAVRCTWSVTLAFCDNFLFPCAVFKCFLHLVLVGFLSRNWCTVFCHCYCCHRDSLFIGGF